MRVQAFAYSAAIAATVLMAEPIAPGGQARAQEAPASQPKTSSTKGLSREQGTTAAPPSLPPGTFDMGNGVALTLNYTGEFAANPSGGVRQGADFAGQLAVGADLDLNKIAGLQGTYVHGLMTERHGRNLQADYIGNDTSVQEIYGGGQTYRLTFLTLEQKLFNDRLDVEIGRQPAQGYFLVSPIYCNFQNNATCGSPTTAFKDTNFVYYPLSTWGAHGKLWLDPGRRFFLHAGVFEVNPTSTLAEYHGFNWSARGATGVNIPIELGYSTTFANDTMPRNYGIGTIVDTSKYSDPVLDAAGGNAFLTGNAPLTEAGRTIVFARFDQMVWRPDPDATQGLTLFGVAIAGVSGRQTQDYYLEGGAVLSGTFRTRPYDTLGFVVSDQKYSGLGLSNLYTAVAQQGGIPSNFSRHQVMMELNYGIQVNPAVRLTPQLQYIVNPTNPGGPFTTTPIPNAFVVGAKLGVDLFTLVGLAKGPGST